MYSRAGEVEVHPWHLPVKTDTWPPTGEPEVHYFAQLAALNDCLYRHKTSSKFLVFQDLDEFIIPYNYDSWAELITDRIAQFGEPTVFYFKCIFFRKEWQKSSEQFEVAAEKYKSVILRHTMRESVYLPFGTRSKYILNPKFTSLVGVHQVWKKSGNEDSVPESEAGLHHYRTWELPNDPQVRMEDVRAINRFGSRLVDKLQQVWSRLDGVPMDINISVYGDHV
ncbi:unnamed protein product [Candidula unifasciata]|uniref:Glycosyltransferase family 92 protein n=1 Tax=Candidula unifasciata TaxID=100452 RepID=A0A8S3ZT52_9EUPU|nr:unnamed protein product [Candidula unifasciata]